MLSFPRGFERTPDLLMKWCVKYCLELDYLYNNETLNHLNYSRWCLEKLRLYNPSKCETYDKCFIQRVGPECKESLNQFSSRYPEKVKVNCSFHLTTGELCNPDAIEDGWIKCCKEPSLENCNCK